MPIKEFICNDCGHVYEEVISFYLDDSKGCPHCDSNLVSRLFSPIGGYSIKGDNGASTKPKGAGSRTKGGK